MTNVTVVLGTSIRVVLSSQGTPGVGMPTGGADNDALFKTSGANYATEFRAITQADITGLVAALLAKLDDSQLSTDGTLAADSDTLIPSQKAVKTYVDAIVAAQDALVFKGVQDCSTNPNYPAANCGWLYRVSVAGKIGGASGPNVQVNDQLICLSDNTPAGTQAAVGANWAIIQGNIDGALTTADIGVTVQAYNTIAPVVQTALDLKANLAGAVFSGVVAFIAGTVGVAGLAVAGDLNTGIYGVSADVLGVTAGGVQVQSWGVGTSTLTGNLLAGVDNTHDFGAAGASRFRNLYAGTGVTAGTYLRINGTNAGYLAFGTADDVVLQRDGAANTLALRNGATAQSFRVYKSYTDAANYERLEAFYSSGAGAFKLISDALGTGTARQLHIGTNASASMAFLINNTTVWTINTSGHFQAGADNTYDIGASGANRARSGYFGTNVVIGYSTTSTAQLHVGAGANNGVPDGAGVVQVPQLANSQTSGFAIVAAGVNDGTNNLRVGLFADNTNSLWGLSARTGGSARPFIIYQNSAEQLRLTTAGLLGIGENTPGYLLDAKATASGATLAGSRLNNAGTGANTRVSLVFQAAGAAYQSIIGGYGASSPEMQFNQNVGSTGIWTWNSNGVEVMRLSGAGIQTAYNNVLFSSDNTYDFGASGANRARTGYFGTSVYAPALGIDTSNYINLRNTFVTTWVNGGARFAVGPSAQLSTTSTGWIQWTPSSDPAATGDTFIYRDAANNPAIRNGTNPQTLTIYNTWAASGVDYERAFIRWSSNSLRIGTEAGGTGTSRPVALYTNGVSRWEMGGTAGHWLPSSDATYDLGSASQQVRDAYLSRNLKIGGAAPAGSAGLATIQSFGQGWGLIGGDVLTDASTKAMRVGILHYTNTEEPMTLFTSGSTAAGGSIGIGGGTSGGNAVMQINFYTAANNTTTTGTNRWQLDEAGHFFPIATATYNIGYTGSRVKIGYFSNSVDVSSGAITASTPAVNIAQTWNSGGVTFTGAITNVTDTASAAASLLHDWQVGGVSRFSIAKTGIFRSATFTVAGLPAAGTAGRRAYVTDALAPAWGVAVAGGGAVGVPVQDNGAAWVCG